MIAEPRFFCPWPWTTMVLLSDGRWTCGCADPRGERILAPAGSPATAVWQGPILRELRLASRMGAPHALCRDCPLSGLLPPDHPERHRPEQPTTGPIQLYVEPSAGCNLACRNDCCGGGDGVAQYRQRSLLPASELRSVLSELGPELQRLELYNYGESFLNPAAPDMIRQAKDDFPALRISTTTNGHPFASPELRRRVLESGLDELMFSIDGVRPASYRAYRRGGPVERVLEALKLFLKERREASLGKPYTLWRYILFRWNDSREEMDQARLLASEYGVDRFCFELTETPPGAPSERFVPGSPALDRIRHEVWGQARFGYRAGIQTTRWPRLVRAGGQAPVRVRLVNRGVHPWEPSTPYEQRWVTLGFSLLDHRGELLVRDHHRAALPGRVEPGGSVEVDTRLPVPSRRGRYGIRIDPVYEGVGWFGELGGREDPPVVRPWWVI